MAHSALLEGSHWAPSSAWATELWGAGKCLRKMGWVLVTATAKPQGPLGSVLILNRLGTGEEPQIQGMEESFDLGGQWEAWGSIVLTALHLPPDSSPPSSALRSAWNEADLSLLHQRAPCQLASG